MSAEHTAHSGAGEANVHGVHHDDSVPHTSLKGYLTGFALSVILTVIPFWLVMSGVIPNPRFAILVVLVLAVVQIFVHMVYFLHLDTHSEAGWNVMAVTFTLVLVVIALSGSLWVMFNMHANMRPMTAEEARTLP